MDVMDHRATEFLAHDRIAGLRSEAIGQQMLQRSAQDASTDPVAMRVETAPRRSLVWRLVRRATAV
jgi:hypothetical protein